MTDFKKDFTKHEIISAIEALDALKKKLQYTKGSTYFPDTGKYRRELYPRQMEFFAAGKTHDIRGFVGGNGSGKSTANAYETRLHLSGKYPSWWKGLRFYEPIDAWVCARENKALREGIQELLFGGIGEDDIGSGLIDREDIMEHGVIQAWAMSGTANCLGSFRCKHYTDGVFDGWSKCEFKTYAQGWKEFQGPTRQWITLDEEPDDVKIYAECLMRLRSKDGRPEGSLAAYFTPTQGFSKTYLAFVPDGVCPDGEHPNNPKKYTVRVSSKEVPHLSKEYIDSMIEELKIADPMNIEARIEGIAAMGSGLVYPVREDFAVVPKFPIPTYWRKAYGMDPGQANFAVIWIAEDPNTGVKYIYDEYKNGKVVYLIHAEAIKARGDWICGGIDPHEAVKPRDTGETVQTYFESLGLNIIAAKGDPDALRARIRAMFETGALKILDTCLGVVKELRTYRFDSEDPNSIARNQDDHRMDAMMYALCTFEQQARSYAEFEEELYQERHNKRDDSGDEGRSAITGY